MTRSSIPLTLAAAALLALAGSSTANAAGSDDSFQSSSPPLNEFDSGLGTPDAAAPATGTGLSIEDFIDADKNHDGYLDRKEFKALKELARRENKFSDALSQLDSFAKNDANGDGKLSARELGVFGAGVG
jgi:Ca2+-binding EF-hand superfamily protein